MTLRLDFEWRLKLQFRGSVVTSDVGPLASATRDSISASMNVRGHSGAMSPGLAGDRRKSAESGVRECDTKAAAPAERRFRRLMILIDGGGGRTRTYEGLASGFTVRPLCRSGHSPFGAWPEAKTPRTSRGAIGPPYLSPAPPCQQQKRPTWARRRPVDAAEPQRADDAAFRRVASRSFPRAGHRISLRKPSRLRPGPQSILSTARTSMAKPSPAWVVIIATIAAVSSGVSDALPPISTTSVAGPV